MIEIRIDDHELRYVLGVLSRRVSDPAPVMHDIGQALVEGIRARIRDGKDWNGRPFAPNSPVTLAKKRGTKPLIDRGNLVGSRLHYTAGRDYVEVGSSAIQSAALHFGVKKGTFGRTRRARWCRRRSATTLPMRYGSGAAPLQSVTPVISPAPRALDGRSEWLPG